MDIVSLSPNLERRFDSGVPEGFMDLMMSQVDKVHRKTYSKWRHEAASLREESVVLHSPWHLAPESLLSRHGPASLSLCSFSPASVQILNGHLSHVGACQVLDRIGAKRTEM